MKKRINDINETKEILFNMLGDSLSEFDIENIRYRGQIPKIDSVLDSEEDYTLSKYVEFDVSYHFTLKINFLIPIPDKSNDIIKQSEIIITENSILPGFYKIETPYTTERFEQVFNELLTCSRIKISSLKMLWNKRILKKQNIFCFEIGKYYRHQTGEEISIIDEIETTMYGQCLVAESNKSRDLKTVGKDPSSAVNWHEITKEEWIKNFS